MKEYNELLTLINHLRNQMIDLIIRKDNLLDPEVIKISQDLDRLLNKYYTILKP